MHRKRKEIVVNDHWTVLEQMGSKSREREKNEQGGI